MATRLPSPRALFLIPTLLRMVATLATELLTEPPNALMFRLTAVASIPPPHNTTFGTLPHFLSLGTPISANPALTQVMLLI